MDAVEDIKQRLNIEDVISEYVELKRAGRNFKALSPFGNEKTPSFMVSPEKQIWHDFSSGKGGNMFSFIMEVEGADFKGALEILARKAGIDLTQYRTSGNSKTTELKKQMGDALELAARFYQAQLKGNKSVLEYVFKMRQFSKETVQAFRLGYSPNNGEALVKFLLSKNFSREVIQKAGLGTQRRTFSDMFRGRLMVPLADQQGQVVGFTARLLVDDPNAPKYINTPQTLLYDKGRQVYGLHLAKEAIRKQNFVVVVEGNLDVIASHQAGITNVVATAGTAMTEAHLKALNRFTTDIRLSFDADAAGMNATERVIPIAQGLGISLSIIDIPAGKDPDELVRKDPKAWQQVITQKTYALDWLVRKYRGQFDIASAEGKRQFTDKLLTLVRKLPDQVEKDHYIKLIASITDVGEQAVRDKLAGVTASVRPLKKTKNVQLPRVKETRNVERQHHLLSVALYQPSVRSELAIIPPDLFVEPRQKALHAYLVSHPDERHLKQIAKDLKTEQEYVTMITTFEEFERYQDLPQAEALRLIKNTKSRCIKEYVIWKKEQVDRSEHLSKSQKDEEKNHLDNLLKQTYDPRAEL